MTEEEGYYFASEEEAVKEEAAWADKMIAEGIEIITHEGMPRDMVLIGHPDQIGAIVARLDEDAPVNPLDIPDHYDLPMHGSITICPKCGMGPSATATDASPSKTFRTIYHPAGVLGGPCGTRFGWPDVQNLGEHLCRVCNKCGWGWPEAVFHGTP